MAARLWENSPAPRLAQSVAPKSNMTLSTSNKNAQNLKLLSSYDEWREKTTDVDKEERAGMASCWCREAVNSLVSKLAELMETRRVLEDVKMVLEMAYGRDDWIDPKLAVSVNLVESEPDRDRSEKSMPYCQSGHQNTCCPFTFKVGR